MGKILIWKTRYTFFRGYKNGSNKDRKVYRYSTERKRFDARATWRKACVTNKTISRWENGNYMPDIEMLSLLSKEFDVSINELISGERFLEEDFKKAADNNLVTALNNSIFTLKEKIAFFKKKWLHEHIATIILCIVVWIGIMLWVALNNSYALLGAIGSILALLFYVVLYNRMMVYVENHAYRATTDNKKNNI